MRIRLLSLAVILMIGAMFANPFFPGVSPAMAAAEAKPKQLSHMVYFSLAESTPENRAKLVAGCKKYLDGHEGVVHFSVGVNAPEYNREVNDRDYDVALNLVFASAKDQDNYQVAPRHLEFIKECKPLWKKVRVFDSHIE
jgi:hypothetical protein